MANKITDGNPLKSKLGIFVKEQGTTSVESLWKGATDHKSLRGTGRSYALSKVSSFLSVTNYTEKT